LEFHAIFGIIQAERRIRDNPIKPHQLPAIEMNRVSEHIVILDIGIGDSMENHVHLAHGPDTAVIVLPVKPEIARMATVFLNVLFGEDEHATGTDARVINPHALLWLDNPYH
jgi:hypothetical protein